MIALIQRVSEASVTVGGSEVAAIGPGMLILLGVSDTDTRHQAEWLARKCARLRIFPDDSGRMNHSVLQTGGQALVVSQFTLCADAQKGNRPSFPHAAGPELARQCYDQFIACLRKDLPSRSVASGVFGAAMEVRLVNDGPVTLILERSADGSPPTRPPR